MKGSELRAKPAAELRGELLKLRKEQFALRLQRATGQAVKPDQFGKVRRSIARLKTALRAGELGVPAVARAAPAAKVAKAPAKPAAARKPAASKAPRAAKKTGAK
jgi:large subunit ribosomal protein L29